MKHAQAIFRTLCLKKIVLLAITTLACGIYANAQFWNPSLAANVFYTSNETYSTVTNGSFDVTSRPLNLGIEFINKFPITSTFGFNAGIRVTSYSVSVVGLNQVHSRVQSPPPLNWKRKYGIYSIPISVYKSFINKSKSLGILSVGVSIGIFSTSSDVIHIVPGSSSNINNQDLFMAGIPNNDNLQTSKLITTIDFGYEFKPFRSLRRLNVGCLVSYQLNKVPLGSYIGTTGNVSENEYYDYNAQFSQKLLNVGCSFIYQLGKRTIKTKINQINCPPK